jgi:hypothetical protein
LIVEKDQEVGGKQYLTKSIALTSSVPSLLRKSKSNLTHSISLGRKSDVKKKEEKEETANTKST